MGLTAFCVGAYSSCVVLPEVALAPIPDGLGFEEAAALPLTGLTAWQARLPELLWLLQGWHACCTPCHTAAYGARLC